MIRELHEARAEAIIDGDEKREEMLERAIALLQSPPKVSVTRVDIHRLIMTLDPCKSYHIERFDHNLHARTEAVIHWLRSLGIAVGEASEAVDSGEGKEGK